MAFFEFQNDNYFHEFMYFVNILCMEERMHCPFFKFWKCFHSKFNHEMANDHLILT